MTEADLALKFIDHFIGFDVYKEVPAGGICDIVVDKGVVRLGIEVKISLSFDVIEQAYSRRPYFHYTYIAIPIKHRVGRIQLMFCKHFGIGILGYRESNYTRFSAKQKQEFGFPEYYIEEHLAPSLNRKPCKIKLEQYMKRSVAGSQNSRITAFGFFVEKMTEVVKGEVNGIGMKELFDRIDYKHYRTLSSFKSCLVKYCNNGVIKGVKFESGKFFLDK